MNWNRDSIEKSISVFVNKYGYLPHPSDYKENDSLPSRETFKRYMGTNPVEYYLEKYPELCSKGYTDRLPRKYVEEQERIFRQLDEFVEKNHRLPEQEELTGKCGLPTYWQVKKYCGSITSIALKRYPEYCTRKYSKNWIRRAEKEREHIITQVKCFVEKNGRMPAKSDLRMDKNMPTYHQVRLRFGSLKEMLNVLEQNKEEAIVTLSRPKKKKYDIER